MTNPHSYYCAQCRATFDFHHLPNCTCSQVQQFVVQHRESHEKYPEDYASESAARLRVDLPRSQPGCDCSICDEPYQPDTQQHTLRTRIIAAIAKADQDWCSDNGLHEDMADAVIRELDEAGYTIVNRAESQAAVARLIGEHSR